MSNFPGTLELFGGSFTPQNYAHCNGQTMAISVHTGLFQVLGTRWGGNGRTNFNMPKIADLKTTEGQSIPYLMEVDGSFGEGSAWTTTIGTGIIGEIIYLPTEYTINGFVECNGASLNKNDYDQLYNLFGTTFGGSGDEFNVPNIAPLKTEDNPTTIKAFMRAGDDFSGELSTLAYIMLWPGAGMPSAQYQECAGQSIQISENPALYSIIGDLFGQDDPASFNLPKLDAGLNGLKYIICVQGVYPRRH